MGVDKGSWMQNVVLEVGAVNAGRRRFLMHPTALELRMLLPGSQGILFQHPGL